MPRPPDRTWSARLRGPSSVRLRRFAGGLAIGALLVGASPIAAAADDAPPSLYVQTNLVADVPGVAAITDPSLVNAWGMSFGPTTPVWVSDNGADVATLYRGANGTSPVSKVALTVSIPDGAPTGQVFNPTTSFHITEGAFDAAARFIFASENGSIDAWTLGLPTSPTVARSMVTVPDAVFKGLAMAMSSSGPRLYATDFHHATVDVFDGSFQQLDMAGAFHDPRIPAGYAPFNVAQLGGQLYVTYAMQDADAHDDVAGQGHGFVDVYDADGHLLRRLVTHGRLDSPWGMALAPAGFGQFSGDLLVGNFGDGRIDAYDPVTGEFAGVLVWRPGKPIVIDGLWGLMFGNGVAGTPTTLLFSAGPDGEQHGLFGTITLAG